MKTALESVAVRTIGIDKTFNLGFCFVFTLTYKNQHVIKRESKDFQIFLGPVMLLYERDFETFFFSHIKQKIGDVETIFGSDEEKAINKAIHNVFPNATHLLCTKHMKDNIRRNLKDRMF